MNSRKQGFTLIELLVVIAIIGIIAGVLLPSLSSGRERAYVVSCSSNLKNIYTFAMMYSDDDKSKAFPIAKGKKRPKAHESLQRLVDFYPDDFKPQTFMCPVYFGTQAEADADGKFVLDDETNAYAWTGKRLKSTAKNKALASDKYHKNSKISGRPDETSGHPRGLNVVYTDGSVSFVNAVDLDKDTDLPPGLVR